MLVQFPLLFLLSLSFPCRQALLGRTCLICPTRFLDCAVQLIQLWHNLCAPLHALCGITQCMSNYCTVQCQFFASNLEKFTPGKKIYTDAASGVSDKYQVCTVHHHHHSASSSSWPSVNISTIFFTIFVKNLILFCRSLTHFGPILAYFWPFFCLLCAYRFCLTSHPHMRINPHESAFAWQWKSWSDDGDTDTDTQSPFQLIDLAHP